ncbi:MAG: thioredoxin family protein [Caldilineaceae bacterium]|nr:thioredoxin family protein [Caldilineaceae bacterium]MBP8110700.1 thioredoxin family protein [Caldilineaceae bacterium]MBP8124868.1 thioredoxin family protein [Caldilineaceae bacterium]MBP9074599.1 thioredoxin family protein [Caldilineaceae bacterium]
MIDLDLDLTTTKIISLKQKSLAVTAGLSFAEYLTAYPEAASILRGRWHETRLSPEDQLFLATYPDWLHLMVVVETDSPDTFILLPLLARLAEAGTRLSLRILTTDDDLTSLAGLVEEVDLLDEEADLDFPLLLVFDEEWDVSAQWGPRPQVADGFLDRWMETHADYVALMDLDDDDISPAQDNQLTELTQRLYHEMRMWYAKTADQAAVTEIRTLLADLVTEESDTPDTPDIPDTPNTGDRRPSSNRKR